MPYLPSANNTKIFHLEVDDYITYAIPQFSLDKANQFDDHDVSIGTVITNAVDADTTNFVEGKVYFILQMKQKLNQNIFFSDQRTKSI